jgi:hypothetical protein
VRFRTVGDLTLTGCAESSASTVDEIIEEIAVARVTERGATRLLGGLPLLERVELALGELHPVPLEQATLVREVDRGDLDLLPTDVVPESSSVQLDSGKIRMCSPPWILPL